MSEGWISFLSEHWPTLTLFIAALFAVYLIVRAIALTFDAVGDAFGPIGQMWRAKRTISQAESEDMRKRLQYLAEQVRALRHRDACYFAFCLYDEEYHRRQELIAAAKGWVLEAHVGFLEFSEKWMRERGIEKELDIWM
jgi:hypothetical protein